MIDLLSSLFDPSGFTPRWDCGVWTPAHGWLHIVADLGVWSAYLAIPCVMAYFVLRRRDVPFRRIFILFGAFIFACGTTHLMEAIIFWWPVYRLAGFIKILTALASWATVLALVRVTPRALAMRSPEELEREVTARREAEAELTATNERLRRSEAMFHGLFQFAPDAVIVAGPDGRIRYANLQTEKVFGYRSDELVGQELEMLIPERYHAGHRQHRTQFHAAPHARAMGEGRELYARRKDGSEFPVDVLLAPLETPDGMLVLANVRDISHRKVNENIIKARARQQAALAEFGQRALESTDLASLLNEATAVVARTLDTDLCRLSELLPGTERFLLRAGWGWQPGCVGTATFDSGAGSQPGYCLLVGQPVIVADLRTETRFTPSPLLLDHGAVSGVCVAVKGKDGAHGVLGAHTRQRRQFTVEDVVFLQVFANMLAALLDRAQAERQVQASLAEKEVLLKEVHHRVKNNLQVISTLLELESQHTRPGPPEEMFRESQNRVRSMAFVHERLYRSRDLAKVDVAGYVVSLTDYLFQTYRAGRETVRLDLAIEPEVGLTVDAAVPCGLLLNELVSNCLKHAFRGREAGLVRIEMRPHDADTLLLVVADDGVGLPAGLDWKRADTFGLQLVAMLVKQLKGVLDIVQEGGTSYRVAFPRVKTGPRGGEGT